MSREEFEKFHIDRSLQKNYKKVSYLSKADKIIETLKDTFTFEKFEKEFLVKPVKSTRNNSVIDALQSYKHILESEGRLKSRDTFQGTINWMKKFSEKKLPSWDVVNPAYLKKLDEFMKEKNLSDSSIGIYMRNLRTVFNIAISDKVVGQDLYPFGRNRYTPPATRNIKKALSLEDIQKLYTYTPESEQESWAKDLWFFSYFANGLNIKDICLLKFSNLRESEIQFTRQKTKNSRKANLQNISVVLIDDLKTILSRRAKKNGTPNDFVFDLLSSKSTQEEIYKTVNQTVKTVNKYMNRIAGKLKLNRLPTTNFARHSYSTVLKRAGVPIEMISENLGHSSIRTTQIYLDSFEKEQRLEAAKHLLAFKDVDK
ncbi:tyrosine-type recombinase/integrase [Niabella ginsengisoli]|uniref:Site-specific integrase n=1 Tax=Niabella ginsengisoli TaxID=522298 RepID=A0ABS9SMA7_9BACT|nr:tyrosine-type recombinase/integrase [Niabella ginsengisoli]MCH5599493.1 site-specific integrase [Niabella ginsengisoli]